MGRHPRVPREGKRAGGPPGLSATRAATFQSKAASRPTMRRGTRWAGALCGRPECPVARGALHQLDAQFRRVA